MHTDLVDANGMGHAFHHGNTLTHNGIPVQVIFGYMRMLRALRVANPKGKILVLWDGKAKFRFDVLPEYKSGREERRAADPKAIQKHSQYQSQIPIVKKAVTYLGVSQLVHPSLEADDLAGLLVKSIPGNKVLRTGDSDWLQLVDENTSWFDPRDGGQRVDLDNFHQATGYFSPGEYIQGKALQGDITDDIPPVGGVGKTGAHLMLAQYRSVENFFAAFDRGEIKKGKKLIEFGANGREAFYRNMKLMDLRNVDLAAHEGSIQATPGELNREKVLHLCHTLGFLSITRNFNEWIAPFENKEKQ